MDASAQEGSRQTMSALEGEVGTAEFPPAPPWEDGGAGEYPGSAVPSEGIDGEDAGLGIPFFATDPRSWDSGVLQEGVLIELSVPGDVKSGTADALIVLFVKELEIGDHGAWASVRYLGSTFDWSHQWATKTFGREKKKLHICRYGTKFCRVGEERGHHVWEFYILPAGVEPPEYVPRAKVTEWRKLYREFVARAKEPAEPPVGAGGDKVHDRIARLKAKLNQARGGGPSPSVPEGLESASEAHRKRSRRASPSATGDRGCGSGRVERGRTPSGPRFDRSSKDPTNAGSAGTGRCASRSSSRWGTSSEEEKEEEIQEPQSSTAVEGPKATFPEQHQPELFEFLVQSYATAAKKGQQAPGIGFEALASKRLRGARPSSRDGSRAGEPAGITPQPDVGLLSDNSQAISGGKSPRLPRARDTSSMHRPLEKGVPARAGRLPGGQVYGSGVSRSDKQLERCTASGSSSSPGHRCGTPSGSSSSSKAYSSGREGRRQKDMAEGPEGGNPAWTPRGDAKGEIGAGKGDLRGRGKGGKEGGRPGKGAWKDKEKQDPPEGGAK